MCGWACPVCGEGPRPYGGLVMRVNGRSDPGYLTAHTGEREPASPGAEVGSVGYYVGGHGGGEPPGEWSGRGSAALGLEGLVAADVMQTVYGELRHPSSGESLGTRPRHYVTGAERYAQLCAREPFASEERKRELRATARREGRQAVGYFDVTFSMPKSVSILHAALEAGGREGEADEVWAAISDGVSAALEYLDREAGYSRAGYHGAPVGGRTSGRFVRGEGLTAAVFRHHLSRDGDPQLHVHIAVLNRQLCPDGKWRSLDSRGLVRARRAADAVAMRTVEASLARRLGVSFEQRPDGVAREVAGIGEKVRQTFSTRRRALTATLSEWVETYREAHGASPSAYVLTLMQEQVNLFQRKAKPAEPPSRDELIQRWSLAARAEVGQTLAGVLESVPFGGPREPVGWDRREVVARAVETLSERRSSWTRYDVIAEIDRHLPAGALDGEDAAAVLDSLADEAGAAGVVSLTPPDPVPAPVELRRDDGRSLFEPHEDRVLSSATVLEAERAILSAAREVSREWSSAGPSGRALRGLGDDQAAAVRALLGSQRRVDVLDRPCGDGQEPYRRGSCCGVGRHGGGARGVGGGRAGAEGRGSFVLAEHRSVPGRACCASRGAAGGWSRPVGAGRADRG